jgi:hypothetical protein
MMRVQRILACALPVLLAACASPRSSGGEAGGARLVTLRDFRSGQRFELASESHTQRVSYYSDARSEAARKVQSDEVMAALVDELERQGLADHARDGRAPALESGGVLRWGLEVQEGERARHWLIGQGSGASDWQEFQRCRDTFLELYNVTVSFQAVRNEQGKDFFKSRPGGATSRP